MKLRKYFLTCLAAVAVFCGATVCGGCGAPSAPTSTEYVLASYENYADLYNTEFKILGKVTLNEDKRFVTDGNKSAKIEIAATSDDYGGSSGGDRLINRIRYYAVDFPAFIDMSTFDYVSIDVYNDSEYQYDLFLSVVSGSDSLNTCLDGGTLAARQWNHLTFDINPYFFVDRTDVAFLEFMIIGVDKAGSPQTTLYLDNVRVAKFDGTVSAPVYVPEKKLSYDGIELLGLDAADDLQYVALSTPHSTGDGWARMTLDPSAERIFGRAALRVEMYAATYEKDTLWATGNEYRIGVYADAVSAVRGAKTVNVKCHNPDMQTKRVKLLCSAGTRTATAAVDIPAGETALLVCDAAAVLQNVDRIDIAVNAWNFGGKATVYFSQLQYTV